MRAKMVLHRNRKRRIEAGHPWVYQSEVNRVEGDIGPDGTIEIVNHQGVFLALGMYNPDSQMVARVFSYNRDEVVNEGFFIQRIAEAYAYRQRFLGGQSESCRIVYGEADFLPGLIVDKYRDVLSVQILSLGMERFKNTIRSALVHVFSPRGIFLRNDVPVRRLEGLPLETGVWMGDVPDRIEIEENGMRFLVDIPEGQKTGYFFDQRENRAAIAPLMTGWRGDKGADVLECFCHTGAFTVHAAKYGAHHVTAVDISESAIQVAQANAALNEVAERVDFVAANAFDFLRDEETAKRSYDVVILDPPAFAKSKRALEGALRGYKEINLRGLKLVRDGGFLVTASCSYHLRPEMFRDVILDAAVDAHKVLRLVHWAGAGKDHPEIAGVDEGHYLKFAIYEVRSR
ncbi:class I SAM-dependent rRNA methyltransferase [Alicyclobacillus ferrooxydans]|uniref:SAM-dependent methyltransferase n=1 Tax=Alicyclobacillus ferrooxydans TaxID=471514 RepID=A0A0P9CXW7_9BACL|nr:class I SAM-dependent rRNA methyltransferase [Alicyclobacillus ferrooxydans]KPV44614.1 SAM-dependent methyltransferase [Alicyclobacillus ferrooxydans]